MTKKPWNAGKSTSEIMTKKESALLINMTLNAVIRFGLAAVIVGYEYSTFSLTQWLILSAALILILPRFIFKSESND